MFSILFFFTHIAGSVKVKSSSVKADTMVSNNCTEEIEQQFEEVKDEKLKKLESERRRLEKENEEKKKLLEKLLQQEQMMLHAAEKGGLDVNVLSLIPLLIQDYSFN